MSTSSPEANIAHYPPEPGSVDFIGPQTEEQYKEMEMSYLPGTLHAHTREMLHDRIEARISRLALSRQVDITQLDHKQMHDLRKRVFGALTRSLRS